MAPNLAAVSRLLPGAAFLAYFVGTTLLYFWGPWIYPMDAGRGALVAFLVAVYSAFGLGYLAGIRGSPCAARATLPVEKLVLISVTVQLALLLPTSHYNTGNWIPNPWAAAQNLGGVYTDSLARRQTGVPYVHYIRILLGPLIALAIPFGVFYWPRLPRLTRTLFVALITGTLALYITMGSNLAGGQWMALFPWFVLAAHFADIHRLDRKGWLKAVGIQAASIALFAVLFTGAMIHRTGSFARSGTMGGLGARLQTASPDREYSGGAAKIGANGLAAYLTHGYYGVYLSLKEPFVPCYGVGNSVFLQRQVVRVTGLTGLLDCTYVVRIEKYGWNASVYWATIFPWIASDVTFPGTIVVVFFIGLLMGRVWIDVLGGQNAFAVALLGQLLLVLYFFPAANFVMQLGETVSAVAGFLGAWLVTRRRDRAT